MPESEPKKVDYLNTPSLKEQILAQVITLTILDDNLLEILAELVQEGKISLNYDKEQIVGYQVLEKVKIPHGQLLTKDEFYRGVDKYLKDSPLPQDYAARFSIGTTFNNIAGRSSTSCFLINFEKYPISLSATTYLTKDQNFEITSIEQSFSVRSYAKDSNNLPPGIKIVFYKDGQELEGFEAILEPNENYLSCKVLPEFELMQGKRSIESIELFEIRVESGSEYTSFSSHDIFGHQKEHLNTQRSDEIKKRKSFKDKLKALFDNI